MKYLIITCLVSLSLQAQGFINWQKPIVNAEHAMHQNHGGHTGKKLKQFQVHNDNPSALSEVYYIVSTSEKRKLVLENGLVSLPKTGFDNYHALVINQKHNNSVNSAVRYIYKHGRPSKTSPTKITHMKKSELEIVPSPLPREHDRYAGSRTYAFELHFNGEVFPNTTVVLSTSNGTEETLKSDENGEFKVTIPNDFKDVKTGRRKNKKAELILKASHLDKGINYTTTLSMPYSVNPVDYWQSQTTGLIVLIIGLILGLFLFRNINKKKKRKA